MSRILVLLMSSCLTYVTLYVFGVRSYWPALIATVSWFVIVKLFVYVKTRKNDFITTGGYAGRDERAYFKSPERP